MYDLIFENKLLHSFLNSMRKLDVSAFIQKMEELEISNELLYSHDFMLICIKNDMFNIFEYLFNKNKIDNFILKETQEEKYNRIKNEYRRYIKPSYYNTSTTQTTIFDYYNINPEAFQELIIRSSLNSDDVPEIVCEDTELNEVIIKALEENKRIKYRERISGLISDILKCENPQFIKFVCDNIIKDDYKYLSEFILNKVKYDNDNIILELLNNKNIEKIDKNLLITNLILQNNDNNVSILDVVINDKKIFNNKNFNLSHRLISKWITSAIIKDNAEILKLLNSHKIFSNIIKSKSNFLVSCAFGDSGKCLKYFLENNLLPDIDNFKLDGLLTASNNKSFDVIHTLLTSLTYSENDLNKFLSNIIEDNNTEILLSISIHKCIQELDNIKSYIQSLINDFSGEYKFQKLNKNFSLETNFNDYFILKKALDNKWINLYEDILTNNQFDIKDDNIIKLITISANPEFLQKINELHPNFKVNYDIIRENIIDSTKLDKVVYVISNNLIDISTYCSDILSLCANNNVKKEAYFNIIKLVLANKNSYIDAEIIKILKIIYDILPENKSLELKKYVRTKKLESFM